MIKLLSIRNLLLTNFTERPFMHRFGGNLTDMLFRLSTEIDDANLENDIILWKQDLVFLS